MVQSCIEEEGGDIDWGPFLSFFPSFWVAGDQDRKEEKRKEEEFPRAIEGEEKRRGETNKKVRMGPKWGEEEEKEEERGSGLYIR